MSSWTLRRGAATSLLLAVSLGLPALLVIHSVMAQRELRVMRSIFLRDRAANIAARLELLPPAASGQARLDELLENEPALRGLQVFGAADAPAGDLAVADVRSGRELFHTEEVRSAGETIFRAVVPLHSAGEIRVAQIDLAASAPDFILVHGRHNVMLAAAAGSVVLAVSLFALWSMHRAARLERRQLETERLAELGSLAAVLAHEIRNPLGAIKGFAQLALENAQDTARKPLDAIVRESRRLETLVESLLMYGRQANSSIRRTAWAPVAADLEAHAREAIRARPIRFTVESELDELDTDPDLLKQALLNLVRNSVEAIPAGTGGSVRVRVRRAAGQVAITVEDDGSGIPEPVRQKLFSPFVTTKASGTGLGLPISKKLAESLGGTLRLSALAPHGTRAELSLHGTNTHR